VHPLASGAVLLDGTDLHRARSAEVARRLGLLPQSPQAPEGMSVAELVTRGRHPHQRFARRTTAADHEAVARALLRTGTAELHGRPVDELSGGQRQRVWIALALAQSTPIMLLDEPTTYLDIAHQLEVLDLLVELNREEGKTIVMVVHDLGQAARYAHQLIALQDGRIAAHGAPHEVVTEELLAEVFGVRARIVPDPDTGAPVILPRGRYDRPAEPPGAAVSEPTGRTASGGRPKEPIR
jgi:iron complex transport system ATP-binding protein